MRTKIISALMVVLMSASVIGVGLLPKSGLPGSNGTTIVRPASGDSTNSQKLKVVSMEDKLSQEQTLSRIKAEYLIENGGYKADDEVVVIVGVDGDSVIETYNEGTTGAASAAAYAESFSGSLQKKSIESKQNRTLDRLFAANLISEVKYTYDTVMNAVAVVTKYKNLSAIENTIGVKSVVLSDTYNKLSIEDSVSYNPVEIYEDTGIYKPGTVIGIDGKEHTYTGKGTSVAVLDSGFDMSHRVFNSPSFDNGSLSITRDTLNAVSAETGKTLLETLNAAKTTKGLTLSDVWYSEKIPYSYDYADKDADVFPYDSEHGTHVAGIIGGSDEVIKGIAPDTQLVLMKVFPDLSEGGKTEDILAALEDAVKLEVDAINMSLGSSCGFARECDEDSKKEGINAVYDRINESGISLITAASNSYSSGFGGERGNTNFVTNPDSGTVGSPSTYEGALSVASISGTKSRYIIANMSADKEQGQIFFYKESNSVAAKENNFFDEMVASGVMGEADENGKYSQTFEYVAVPGAGLNVNFDSLGDSLRGKIALVRRGNNSFEEKAALAKAHGAVACIIYNNVDGDILMSMGKTEHIPTISVSKDDGEKLAAYGSGTFTVSSDYQAGPFMSDFSSWGPTPSLGIKPEITAHGGNIKSAVPGSYEEDGKTEYRYDQLSGTSMATPNLCGIVILIRQYIKDNYKDLTDKQIKDLTNQLMMSTADIIMNEEANPYSPRKQGAGLANFAKTVKTKAYITVDGSDRSKLELKDDPMRVGVYKMAMNIVNLSDEELYYDCSLVGMTESVSSSDDKHVAETPYILGGSITVKADGKEVTGSKIKVGAGSSVKVEVVYTLDEKDKTYIESHFENGMYVEGFVKFKASEDEVDLNIPFLAFYGDWTEAPMFDVDYYEVESTAHDASLSDEDDEKIKADYYATTPYGSYFYNYMIPLGTYLYSSDTESIPATREHIAISDSLGTIDGINAVAAGLLRGAKKMEYSIVDKVTGETVWEYVDYNANKSYSNGASPVPYYDDLKIKSATYGFINNRQYTFTMTGKLDYDEDRVQNNKNNSFSFDFYMDNEAPVLREVTFEKEYDESEEKYHYYINMVIYDNHYAMSVTPIIFTSSSTYTFLSENPIPVNGEKGKDTVVTFEITDYLDAIYSDAIIPNGLAFSIDDYALNSNIFVCQLPGTKGDFKFTKNGMEDGEDLIILSAYEDQLLDLKQYLYTADETVGANRENLEYLKHLVWTSSNEDIVEVKEGILKAKSSGRATITAREKMDGKQAVLIINVKKNKAEAVAYALNNETELPTALEELSFDRYETVFAFARAAQTSEIGKTGDVNYFTAKKSVSLYPGESIKLFYDMNPWYLDSEYTLVYSSNNPAVASVAEDGTVKALAEGEARITLTASKDGEESNISATVDISVKSPFVIENRTLIAYKGIGGDVVIPDDEGILYIGSYAFCLYTTDNTIELGEDDYDANKIPDGNKLVESVEIPEGVDNIQKYAFYNCTELKKVILPSTVKYIREYAFAGAKKLTDIYTRTLEKDADGKYILSQKGELGKDTIVIGARAFRGCKKLDKINLSKITSIGERAFEGCTSLTEADVTTLRNSGKEIFKDCTALSSVEMNEYTKLSYAMFVNTGFEEVTVYEKNTLPDFCFANCEKLKKVTFVNAFEKIGKGAFSQCTSLETVEFSDKKDAARPELTIGDQAFYADTALKEITLPDGKVSFGGYAFYMCSELSTVRFAEHTRIGSVGGTVLQGTAFTVYNAANPAKFVVDANNEYYTASTDNSWLLSKDGKTIIYAIVASGNDNVVIDGSKYSAIGESAFAGMPIKTLSVINANDFVIGAYAFANCELLEKVVLPENGSVTVGNYAFAYAGVKTEGNTKTYTDLTVENLDKVTGSENADGIGMYAFTGSAIKNVKLGAGVYVGEGAFFASSVEKVSISKNSVFRMGAFQSCTKLKELTFDGFTKGENGNVTFGEAMFARSTALTGSIDLNGVTEEIPAQLFYGCRGILVVKLDGVKKIGNSAFAECASLSKVIFTDGGADTLEIIGDYAFGKYTTTGGSPVFTEIALPSSLKKIGEGAFLGCEGLTSVTVPEGVTFDKDDIIDSEEETKKMHFTGDYVFFGCTKLATVRLPHSVERIGDYMFANCESITSVQFDNVKVIGDYAFTQPLTTSAERTLKKFNFESVISIGEAAFANNEVLSCEINAPELEHIGKYAFKDTAVSAVNAPSLRVLDDYAFNSVALRTNSNLKEFNLTDSIEKVGKAVFAGCSAFERFTFTNNGRKIETATVNDYALIENGVLYTKMPSGEMQLTCVPASWKSGGVTATELRVRNDVYRIEFYAGSANKNITSIILPETLKLIGNYAFYGYNGLLTEDAKVVFRSYAAPALENSYDSNSSLDEKAAGYGLLHPYLNLFGLELSYYNFVDLAGSNKEIELWVPDTVTGTTDGYDSLVYTAYFGELRITDHSYLAMDSNMSSFVDYAKNLLKTDAEREFTLADEKAVTLAVNAYNAVDKSGAERFYDKAFTEEEWNNYCSVTLKAKEIIRKLKIASMSEEIKALDKDLLELPDKFSPEHIQLLYTISERLDNSKRSLYNLEKYDALIAGFGEYMNAANKEISAITETAFNGFSADNGSEAGTAGAAAMLAALSGAVGAIIRKFC